MNTEERKDLKLVSIEQNTDSMTYKERQRYYDEKYKNREKIFFAQQPAPLINGLVIKKVKGKTYKKIKEMGEL